MFTRRTQRAEFLHELESLLVQGHDLVLFDVEVAEVKCGHLVWIKNAYVGYLRARLRPRFGKSALVELNVLGTVLSVRDYASKCGIRIVKVSMKDLTVSGSFMLISRFNAASSTLDSSEE